VDLRAAAEQLGVHYQTAYKWVRDGSLPAVKFGSAYEIGDAEVARVLAARRAPQPPPQTTVVRDWEAQRQRLYELLLVGDELTARSLIERLVNGGVDVVTVMADLFTPVLVRLGEEWASGLVSIGVEHRATGICERLLARVAQHPRGRPRGKALVATLPGEEHALPAAMAAVALRQDRWQVHHLGTQVPVAELVALAQAVEADLAVVTVTLAEGTAAAERARGALAAAGCRVLVGSAGASLHTLVRLARGAGSDGLDRPPAPRPSGVPSA